MQYGIYSNEKKKWLADKLVKRRGTLYAVCGLSYDSSWCGDRIHPFLSLTEAQTQVKLLPKKDTYQIVSVIGKQE